MSFDYLPTLKGDLVELRPLSSEDFDNLYAVARDPLIWEKHPGSDRCQERIFRAFVDKALASNGALIVVDAKK